MISALTLPYPEHLSATRRAYTLSRWPTILHDHGFGILHFLFGTAFHTVCLHWIYLPFDICGMDDRLFLARMSIGEGIIETRGKVFLPLLSDY